MAAAAVRQFGRLFQCKLLLHRVPAVSSVRGKVSILDFKLSLVGEKCNNHDMARVMWKSTFLMC